MIRMLHFPGLACPTSFGGPLILVFRTSNDILMHDSYLGLNATVDNC
jgi:hypothetical protein